MIETVLTFLGGPVFTFLGGATFRALWGEVSSYFTRKQEHRQQLDLLELQGRLDAEKHARDMESIRVQAEQQVQVIKVAAQGEVDKLEADAWADLAKATGKAIGIAWVDAWNACIRPAGATWALVVLTGHALALWALPPSVESVAFAFLGLFVADRALGKRAK